MGKKLYVTTAIPYVNGTPHIGNALDYLLADIWTRYQKQNGREVRFQIGTDEHGTKNAMKAAELGMTPQQYVDQAHVPFKQMAERVGASYTDFIRTTDKHHEAAVQYIWQKLKPHIYKDTYEGWYCNGCEQFYTEKEVAEFEGICPNHKTPFEQLSEENYYLRISDFTDQIRKAIESNKMQIIPKFRRDEILALIGDEARDVSISRPKGKLAWGVPVPDDPEQVIYVWIDALSNYITVIGYPDQPEWREYWPADLEIVGKDILRFHAIIWPAILLGLGIDLPKRILAHGFVNIGGAKISKTVGNVIDPGQIIDEYGLDAFRYYFARHIPTQDDGDFTWERFETAYNTELANDLGNLVSRVAQMVTRYQAGVVGDERQSEHDMEPYLYAMDNLRFDNALDHAWITVRSLNQFIERLKPWEIAKNRDKDPEAEAHLAEVLAHAVSTLVQISDLIAPFMPDTSAAIRTIFASGVIPDEVPVLFPRKYLHSEDPRTAPRTR